MRCREGQTDTKAKASAATAASPVAVKSVSAHDLIKQHKLEMVRFFFAFIVGSPSAAVPT